MKITKLKIKNFLGISELETELGPGINMVKGDNGVGKSSLLKAILQTFEGGSKNSPWVIHRMGIGDALKHPVDPEVERASGGTAEIFVELDGNIQIRRTITPGKSEVLVTEKRGTLDVALRPARKILDEMVRGNTVLPVEFYEATPQEQRRVLLGIVPDALSGNDVNKVLREYGILDVTFGPDEVVGLKVLQELESVLMEKRKYAWSQKEHHEEVAEAERKKLPEMYVVEEVPEFGDLLKKLDQAHNSEMEVTSRELQELDVRQEVDLLNSRMKRLEEELTSIRVQLSAKMQAHEKALTSVKEAKAKVVPSDPIRQELERLELRREHRKSHDQMVENQVKQAGFVERVKTIDEAIRKGVRMELPALLWSRLDNTPLRGLDIGMEGDRITVSGKDINNLSDSERATLAMKLGEATAVVIGDGKNQLKTICMDRFEALGEKTKAMFFKNANPDFQYVICERTEGPLTVTQGAN